MARNPDTKRNVAVGCFVTPLGFFSGAMVGVLAAKIVDFFTKAPSCPEIPSCSWGTYAMWGGLLGALTLPALVVSRLVGKPKQSSDTTDTNRS